MSLSLKTAFITIVLPLLAAGQSVVPVFQTGHFAAVKKVDFHPNQQNLVSAGEDGKLIVWNMNLGLQRAEVLAHQGGLLDFDFLNDSTIISIGNNNQLKTWSFPDLLLQERFSIDVDSIQAIAVTRQQICLVGKQVHLYSLENRTCETLSYQSKWLFKSVDFHKAQNLLVVTGPKDNYAVTIDLADPILFEKYFVGNIYKAKFADSLLLMATTTGSLQYQFTDKRKKQHYDLIDDLNYVSAMDAHKATIALGTAFGFTTILNAKTHKGMTNVGLNGVAISAVSFSENSNWLAIGNANGVIYLYDAKSFKINNILKGASASVTDIKLKNAKMVVGYSDGIVRHINLSDNRIISNSIKLDQVQEQNGVSYAILSVNEITDKQVDFTVLKTNRHHTKTSVLTEAQEIKAEWDLKTNKITLSKSISSPVLKKKIRRNFDNEIPYRFNDYSKVETEFSFNNEHYQLNNNSYSFYKLNGPDTVFYDSKHSAPIRGLRYLPTYKLIFTYSSDGSIRIWDDIGNYLAVLYLSGQYSFFYQSKSNFYFSSKEILGKIGFLNDGKLYSYEQFDVFYNRPAEVMKSLPFFSAEDISDYQKAYFKRLQKLGVLDNQLSISDNLPEIIVDYFESYNTKSEIANFSLSMADAKSNISAFSYRINGIEKRMDLAKPSPNFETEIEIVLASGINQIEFFCINESGVRSMVKKKIITCEKQLDKPDLYIVTIGVSDYENDAYDLKYARKDAEEISQILAKNKSFGRAKTKTIYDNEFTKNTFADIEEFLKKANINDVILFFYAGHGVLDGDFNYYLGTHNIDFKNPENLGLSFDRLENMFESLNCRNRLMLVDACFSGEIDKTSLRADTSDVEKIDDIQFRASENAAIDDNGEMGIFELSKRTFTDLRVSKGTNILSSSSGIEFAFEGDKWGNGLFTYVLKKGLIDGEADLNDDKQIRIMELQVYLRETVSILSNGNQNPILRKENIKNNFVVW